MRVLKILEYPPPRAKKCFRNSVTSSEIETKIILLSSLADPKVPFSYETSRENILFSR